MTTRDDICFALFLFLLFIAPEVPLGAILQGVPALSSISFGFVGLLLWLIVSPKPVLKIRTQPSWGILVVSFAIYAWFVSMFSGKITSILYASQYFFYTLFGFLVLRTYLARAYKSDKLNDVFAVFIIIGLIYSIGTIISVFVGPIYPELTQWTVRMVEGSAIQRGVGFSENPNASGGLQIFFLAASIYLYPTHQRYQWLAVAIMGSGLLVTLSRSALLSFMFAFIALGYIWFLRTVLNGKISRQSIYHMANLAFLISGCLIIPLGIVYLFGTFELGATKTALLGLGIANDSLIRADTATRLELWYWGINNWIEQGEFDMLFGVGFHNSQAVNQYGTFSTAHNFYISALNDFGIVGLLVIICAIIGSISKASSRFITNPKRSNIYSFAFLTISALSIHNLSEVFLYSPKYIIMLLFPILLIDTISQPTVSNPVTKFEVNKTLPNRGDNRLDDQLPYP